jgi:hypothetical protein
VRHVAHMVKMGNALKLLVRKREEKSLHGRNRVGGMIILKLTL